MDVITGSILVTIILTFYLFAKWKFSYWERAGVEYVKPKNVLENKIHEIGRQAYNELKSKGVKIGGTFIFFAPFYVAVDLELFKCITLKDFDHFYDRTDMANPEVDPITGNLFDIGGEPWKKLRGKLSPAFTSGKIKTMFNIMAESSEQLVKLLTKQLAINKTVNVKEILRLYTIQIIGSCAFGVETQTMTKSLSKYKKIAELSLADVIRKVLIKTLLPRKFANKFKLTDRFLEKFYFDLVRDTVKYRKENNVQRNDFMRILMELEDGGLTMEEMAAQCFVFFIGGFETSSSTMSLALMELSQHEDMQEKLRQEILNQTEITYDSLMEMEYLDQVLKETLRLHPPVKTMPRRCTKNFPVPGSDVVIKTGQLVLLSYEGIHRDPEYYPDPDRFDPDRFSEENKSNIRPFTYLPFGEGPRMCIAWRFGVLQAKLGLVTILSNFKVTLSSKQKFPLVYDTLGVDVKGGIWLDFEKFQ